MKTWKAHPGQVRGVAFAPDGSRLATYGFGDTFARLWDAATGAEVAWFDVPVPVANGLTPVVGCIAFSHCGKYFAVGGSTPAGFESGVRAWELATGEPRGETFHPNEAPTGLAFTPADPPGLLVVDSYRLCHFPDVFAPRPGARMRAHGRGPDRASPKCSRVLYSAGREWVATNGKSKAVVWEAATLKPRFARAHKKGPQNGPAAFDPAGEVLAVAHGTKVDLWRFADPEAEAVELSGHKLPVWAVGFLHGGRTVQTASSDGTVRLWDAATGKERHRYDFGIGKVYAACFAPDGLTCAAGGESGQVVVWDVDA